MALAHTPNERYETAAEFRQDLVRYLGSNESRVTAATELGMFVALVLLCLGLFVTNHDFLGASNVLNTTC